MAEQKNNNLAASYPAVFQKLLTTNEKEVNFADTVGTVNGETVVKVTLVSEPSEQAAAPEELTVQTKVTSGLLGSRSTIKEGSGFLYAFSGDSVTLYDGSKEIWFSNGQSSMSFPKPIAFKDGLKVGFGLAGKCAVMYS